MCLVCHSSSSKILMQSKIFKKEMVDNYQSKLHFWSLLNSYFFGFVPQNHKVHWWSKNHIFRPNWALPLTLLDWVPLSPSYPLTWGKFRHFILFFFILLPCSRTFKHTTIFHPVTHHRPNTQSTTIHHHSPPSPPKTKSKWIFRTQKLKSKYKTRISISKELQIHIKKTFIQTFKNNYKNTHYLFSSKFIFKKNKPKKSLNHLKMNMNKKQL